MRLQTYAYGHEYTDKYAQRNIIIAYTIIVCMKLGHCELDS